MSWRFGWWEALAFTHRWLGIAGCLLFLLWFVSGIAMMYVRMPEVTAAERLAHLAVIEGSLINFSVADAAAVSGASAASVQVTMLGSRPVYRFGGRTPSTVFADTGQRLENVSGDEALALAHSFAPGSASTVRAIGLASEPDQWMLQSRAHLPAHQIALGDAAGTEIYVSTMTGEVVMETTARERFWAYIGPVAHWLYLPVLRRNGPLWTDVIIWSSSAGCVLCILGLVAGLVRFSPRRRFSLRGGRTMSPYAGWLKWHHYAGLIFGVFTFTWTFSGLLSMDPFPSLSSGGPTSDQRRAVSGTPSGPDALTTEAIRSAVTSARSALQPKELSLIRFRGRQYWLASESPARHVLVDAAHPDGPPFPRFEDAALEAVGREAMPGAQIVDATWLAAYDDYYYDRDGVRSLPVLRVRYDDPQQTWIYLDPGRGALALVVRPPDRLNRWLYHGLHSLDFPFLYSSRPAWDVLVIALSLGGIVGVASSLVPTWRRLRRHLMQLRG
jgi:uncharacterized iron-regulated membrane protein